MEERKVRAVHIRGNDGKLHGRRFDPPVPKEQAEKCGDEIRAALKLEGLL